MKAIFAIIAIFILAIIIAGYIQIGVLVADDQNKRAEFNCPGHRHAQEAYPWVRPFMIAIWPAGIFNNVITDILPPIKRICDRFDL